jgi:pyrroloquinoline-quinone synthase
MNIQQQLDAIIERWNLLNHPFYKAWSNGTLPVEKLKEYSGEYASFINTVAESWETCGYEDIADTERGHYLMWKDFAGSLGNETIESNLPAIRELVAACGDHNRSVASALGGLYAFEAQQPYTAQSKLKGLREHYADLHCNETYFIVHENDFDEPAILAKDMHALSEEEQQAAAIACETTCEKLWNALTAIHHDPAMCN